jgi:ABC-2 type transport system permease protein
MVDAKLLTPAQLRQSRLSENLHTAYAIFLRDARIALSYPVQFWLTWLGVGVSVATAYLISRLIAPSQNFGFGGHSSSYFDYLVVNLAFVGFQSIGLVTFAKAIRDGQLYGTIEVVLATPTPVSVFVLSAGLWAFTMTAIEATLYLIIALFFGLNLHNVNVISALVFIVLAIASMSPFGVLSAAAVMVFKQTGPVEFFMTSMANIFGGVFLPVSKLPLFIQYVSWMLPITHALNGIRGAVNGASLTQLMPDVIWLLVESIVLLPLSLLIFKRAVHVARIDGTLGQY